MEMEVKLFDPEYEWSNYIELESHCGLINQNSDPEQHDSCNVERANSIMYRKKCSLSALNGVIYHKLYNIQKNVYNDHIKKNHLL